MTTSILVIKLEKSTTVHLLSLYVSTRMAKEMAIRTAYE